MIELDTKLNLQLRDDRNVLADVLRADPRTCDLADLIDDYLVYFTAGDWRTVYAGGAVHGPKGSIGAGIDHLLRIVALLNRLAEYPGFDDFVSTLQNAAQVRSTMFEIESAAWCTQRKRHKGLHFSPAVERNGSTKRPEFLWSTDLGDIWCECKQARELTSDQGRRQERTVSTAEAVLKHHLLGGAERLDILLPTYTLNGLEARMSRVVEQAIRNRRDGIDAPVVLDGIEARIMQRDEPCAWEQRRDVVTCELAKLASTPVSVGDRSAVHMIVVMNFARARGRLAKSLISQAKKQLPTDRPCAIFLDGVGTTASVRIVEQELARNGALAWVCLQSPYERRAVWRIGQPYDDRLLVSFRQACVS